MKSSVVLGNGESRSWFCPDYLEYPIADLELWGCNAIYRDGVVDNLVSKTFSNEALIGADSRSVLLNIMPELTGPGFIV